MAGYFHALARQATPPGPRIRPVAVPFESPAPVPAQEPARAIPAIASWAAFEPPHATHRPQPREDAEVPEPRANVAALVPPPASVPLIDAPHDDTPRPVSPTPPNSTLSAAGSAESTRTIESPARTIARDRIPSSAVSHPMAAQRPITVRMPPPSTHPREAAAARGEQPPEIHVHIGRIELTAVTAPAAPKPASQPARKAMPLNEYLQRRNRNAR